MAEQRRVVELAHPVVARRADVEVEAPIDVMVVHVAYARMLDRRECETRADPAVGVQPPLADVTVPAGFHLADEHDFVGLDVDADAEEVAGIRSGVDDGLRRRRAKPESRRDIGAGCLDHALLILPVPVRPAGVTVVLDVQDRHVRAIQHPLALVVDVPQLDAGTVRAARGAAGRTARNRHSVCPPPVIVTHTCPAVPFAAVV